MFPISSSSMKEMESLIHSDEQKMVMEKQKEKGLLSFTGYQPRSSQIPDSTTEGLNVPH